MQYLQHKLESPFCQTNPFYLYGVLIFLFCYILCLSQFEKQQQQQQQRKKQNKMLRFPLCWAAFFCTLKLFCLFFQPSWNFISNINMQHNWEYMYGNDKKLLTHFDNRFQMFFCCCCSVTFGLKIVTFVFLDYLLLFEKWKKKNNKTTKRRQEKNAQVSVDPKYVDERTELIEYIWS